MSGNCVGQYQQCQCVLAVYIATVFIWQQCLANQVHGSYSLPGDCLAAYCSGVLLVRALVWQMAQSLADDSVLLVTVESILLTRLVGNIGWKQQLAAMPSSVFGCIVRV